MSPDARDVFLRFRAFSRAQALSAAVSDSCLTIALRERPCRVKPVLRRKERMTFFAACSKLPYDTIVLSMIAASEPVNEFETPGGWDLLSDVV